MLPTALHKKALCRPILLVLLIFQPGCTQDRPIYYRIGHQYSVHDPQFTQTMNNLLRPPLVDGNQAVSLPNGKNIFPAMLSAIRAAQKTVTFETYVYWKGKIGDEFTAALIDRARAGVKVHVLIDWFGGNKIDQDYLTRMHDAG